MALPSSGVIRLTDIQTEFGGSNPIGLDEYYRNGSYVSSNNTNVPTSGAISLSNFYNSYFLVTIPNSGSQTNYYNLTGYSYANPAVISWTKSGTTLNWSVTSYTTYCGSAKTGSGSASITETTVGGYPVQTASFTFGHAKDCCNGNQNYVYEHYTFTMNYPNTLVITATATTGSQSGC